MKANSQHDVDPDLLARCRNGDGNAFAPLLAPYRSRLYAYALQRCGETSAAEDLLQDTLIKVWEGLPAYRARGKFSSWLFTIAHRAAVDAERRRQARKHVEYRGDMPDHPREGDPASDVVAAETRLEVERLVAMLPEKQRDVFLLRQHGDLRFREIAELLGEPLGTVLGHMHNAIQKLRKGLLARDAI